MLRTLLNITLVGALIYLGLCAALFFLQRSLIYFPQPRSAANGAPTINLPVDGATVVITTRPREGSNAVIYLGGNAEDVSFSLPGLAEAFGEHALFLMHYRGYGGSTGKPTEAALLADALALFDQVSRQHKNVVVVGRSLGSGVAVYLASMRPVNRLVLVTPYNSIQALAAQQFALFPVRWLLQDKFESWRYAPLVAAPTLLVAAERDEVIPRASTESLLTSFQPGVATMRVVSGTGHNTISESPAYVALLRGAP